MSGSDAEQHDELTAEANMWITVLLISMLLAGCCIVSLLCFWLAARQRGRRRKSTVVVDTSRPTLPGPIVRPVRPPMPRRPNLAAANATRADMVGPSSAERGSGLIRWLSAENSMSVCAEWSQPLAEPIAHEEAHEAHDGAYEAHEAAVQRSPISPPSKDDGHVWRASATAPELPRLDRAAEVSDGSSRTSTNITPGTLTGIHADIKGDVQPATNGNALACVSVAPRHDFVRESRRQSMVVSAQI